MHILVKAPPKLVCTENTARGGHVKRQIQHSASPRAVFVSRHPLECCIFHTHELIGGALTVIAFLVLSDLIQPSQSSK